MRFPRSVVSILCLCYFQDVRDPTALISTTSAHDNGPCYFQGVRCLVFYSFQRPVLTTSSPCCVKEVCYLTASNLMTSAHDIVSCSFQRVRDPIAFVFDGQCSRQRLLDVFSKCIVSLFQFRRPALTTSSAIVFSECVI